jgi:predicted enzyme related to lactoylglutathione lyase
MTRNPVGWFEIYVQDMNRAKAFYEELFQVKLERLSNPEIEMWAFPMSMDAPGAAGSLVKMEGFQTGQNSVLIYFMCEDCGVVEQRAVKLGARVQRSKISIGEYGFISLVFDSENNMIGLHSMK